MARLSVIEREKKRAKMVQKYKTKRDALRKVAKDANVSGEDRWNAQVALQRLPRNSSSTRYTRRCLLTGRPRGVYRKFELCRNMIRIYAMNGEIPGLTKSSW